MDENYAIKIAAIKNSISIFQVFDKLHIEYPHGPVTQQILCPMHEDRRPSARVYADTNKVFCFTCAQTWDQVQLVKDKIGARTAQPVIDWFEQNFTIGLSGENLSQTVKTILDMKQSSSIRQLAEYVESQLMEHRFRLGLDNYSRLLYALDLIVYRRQQRELGENNAADALKKILRSLENHVQFTIGR